jgi:hypothetical protein
MEYHFKNCLFGYGFATMNIITYKNGSTIYRKNLPYRHDFENLGGVFSARSLKYPRQVGI